jgi:predicted GNAT superfamily acetyltransferase
MTDPAAATVRSLSSQSEYEQAVALQEQIWGADVRETVPACILQISQEVGGIAEGAFAPDGQLVGFVFGLTGLRDGTLAHWSHILAVEESWRDKGIGRQLKEHQRNVLLEIGVERMFWTFDPLESRNAHLNLNILGASVESYVPHFYGKVPVAATDTVIGTDRFVVRWDLSGQSTKPVCNSLHLTEIPSVTLRSEPGTSDQQVEPIAGAANVVRVGAPDEIQILKRADPDSARQWREMTRCAFTSYLDAGYAVAEFRPETVGLGGWYILVDQRSRERMLQDEEPPSR